MPVVNVAPAPSFQGSDFDHPFFEAIGTPASVFNATKYGQLHHANDQISLQLLTDAHRQQCPEYMGAKWGWVVADVRQRLEDETVCHFEAHKQIDTGYVMIPNAEFAVYVEGGEAGPETSKSEMGINWSIRGGNSFYVPYPALMHTPNTGGYRVQVADKLIPSEQFNFGLIKGGGSSHATLVIKFALIALPFDYPFGR